MEPFTGTKKLIFETAIRLFSEQGVESTSMRDIAEAVGIQSSSIYNHFRSKQELLTAMYSFFDESCYTRWPVLRGSAQEKAFADPLDLHTVFDLPMGISTLHVNILKIAVSQSNCDPTADALAQKYLLDQPKQLFCAAAEQMGVDTADLDTLGELFASLCFGGVMRTFTSNQLSLDQWYKLTEILYSFVQQRVLQ